MILDVTKYYSNPTVMPPRKTSADRKVQESVICPARPPPDIRWPANVRADRCRTRMKKKREEGQAPKTGDKNVD